MMIWQDRNMSKCFKSVLCEIICAFVGWWIEMSIGLHVKCHLLFSDFKENWIFLTVFSKKSSDIKFHENPSSGYRSSLCDRNDRHDEANIRFSPTLRKGLINLNDTVPEMAGLKIRYSVASSLSVSELRIAHNREYELCCIAACDVVWRRMRRSEGTGCRSP